ncbi:short-chain dehydrogenase/reductase SDR [Kribbella flavida DSM 17836]|uniref:Short-chain dehydrogenase/reductase SDR n=1 Tax=Kribbella flavida (strain DSM 17836 / JCM 10339 / NBRC 14399) TaxID=479435 RepID=D2Q4C9_KRIFD|nr:SDR family NAD(P)-dependent oxidoreductase [Kribbella flavida]ADB32243.1 short-chain dehydrogenase/reductase SDR [Kribbella flavida DSM 17836]
MGTLAGRVALVTGASRGVGKGIALGLGEQGATVYVTGRAAADGPATAPFGGSVQQTADEVTALGGRGIGVVCDHVDDARTRQVVERVVAESGRLDLVVNNVWGGYEHFWDGTEFWQEAGFWTEPISRWDSMFGTGVRAHYVTSVFAAPTMVAQGSGLIVNVSSDAAEKVDAGVSYGVAKSATDRMVACMAHDLRTHGVAAVSLYPGLVRTEAVLRAAEFFDLSDSESPQFIGRAVAALAADPDVLRYSGQVVRSAALGREYGFTDVDGRRPGMGGPAYTG